MASTGVSRITGIDPAVAIKAPCAAATTTNITLSGAQTIDGVAVAETTQATRVLVRAQTDSSENGVYDVKGTAWVRSDDFDGNRDVVDGTLVSVTGGTVYAGSTFRITTDDPIVINTSDIDFVAANAIDVITVVGTAGVDTYAKLRALTSGLFSAGDVIKCTGDGIFGDLKIKDGANTDNGGTIFQFTDDPNRYAERVFDGHINVLWFGADRTGATDSSTEIQAAIDFVPGRSVYFPAGTYMCSFSMKRAQIIYGDGTRTSGARSETRLIPPTGASYVIILDGDAIQLQHCQIRDLSVENPSAVANCDGIYFKGADVLAINDSHRLRDIFISGFRYGIRTGARLILCVFENVETLFCTKGLYITGDPSNYAVNANTWINCRWVDCAEEGVRTTGFNIANKFITCNVENNNTDEVAGIAGMYWENAEGLYLDNPYFELNGAAVVVDSVDRLNNSIGLLLGGVRCFNLKVDNGWMVQSGTMIAFEDTTSIIGGYIGGVRLVAEASGIDIYCKGTNGGNAIQPLIIDSNNYFTRGVEIPTLGTGIQTGSIRQARNATYSVSNTTNLNLLVADAVTFNNASGFTITAIDNRFPGLRLTARNIGAGSISIAAALMADGVARTIFPNDVRSFFVSGFPANGLLVEIGESSRYTKTKPTTVAALTAAGSSAIGAGTTAFVTDANATTFASIVAGGGANGVPVYSDGTNWRIG